MAKLKELEGNIYDRSKEKKNKSNSHKKYRILFPQCVACYLTAYYVEGNPF